MDKYPSELTLDDIYQSWREVWARQCVEQNGDNTRRVPERSKVVGDIILKPFGVYDTRACRLVYIGLHQDHEATWDVFLGWPSHGEILAAMAEGLSCVALTVTYDPPTAIQSDDRTAPKTQRQR